MAQWGKLCILIYFYIGSCLDIQTGEELWQSRLPHVNGAVYSSPVFAENRLYVCREEGTVYVCEITSNGIKILNQTKFDDKFVASPVLVQGRILLRHAESEGRDRGLARAVEGLAQGW